MKKGLNKIAAMDEFGTVVANWTPQPHHYLSPLGNETAWPAPAPRRETPAAKDEPLRRQPQQDRSRERVETILHVTARLIGEKGIAAVSMKEIAVECGMPLATVYHYFPNKSAIIETLYRRLCSQTWAQLKETLAKMESRRDISAALESIVDGRFSLLQAEPEIQDLMNAVQADKALQNIDLEITREQASFFSDSTARLIDADQREDYDRLINLVFQLEGKMARLALAADRKEAEKIVNAFKFLVRGQLRQFADSDG